MYFLAFRVVPMVTCPYSLFIFLHIFYLLAKRFQTKFKFLSNLPKAIESHSVRFANSKLWIPLAPDSTEPETSEIATKCDCYTVAHCTVALFDCIECLQWLVISGQGPAANVKVTTCNLPPLHRHSNVVWSTFPSTFVVQTSYARRVWTYFLTTEIKLFFKDICISRTALR